MSSGSISSYDSSCSGSDIIVISDSSCNDSSCSVGSAVSYGIGSNDSGGSVVLIVVLMV